MLLGQPAVRARGPHRAHLRAPLGRRRHPKIDNYIGTTPLLRPKVAITRPQAPAAARESRRSRATRSRAERPRDPTSRKAGLENLDHRLTSRPRNPNRDPRPYCFPDCPAPSDSQDHDSRQRDEREVNREMTLAFAPLDGSTAALGLDAELPCRQYDPDLWFADAPADLEVAKALCGELPAEGRVPRRCARARRALGRLGWRDLRAWRGRSAQAAAWPSAQGGPRPRRRPAGRGRQPDQRCSTLAGERTVA